MSTRVWALSRAVLSTSIWDGPLPEPVYVFRESSIWFRYSSRVAGLGHVPSQGVHTNHGLPPSTTKAAQGASSSRALRLSGDFGHF